MECHPQLLENILLMAESLFIIHNYDPLRVYVTFSLCIHQPIPCWFQILATVNSTAIHMAVQLSFYANTICLGYLCRSKRAGSCDESYDIHVYDKAYERGSTLFSAMALLIITEPAVHRSSLSPAFHCALIGTVFLMAATPAGETRAPCFDILPRWPMMWNIFFLNYVIA